MADLRGQSQSVGDDQPSTLTTFRLLDLPPELRLLIYEYAVTSNDPVQITFIDDGDSDVSYKIWKEAKAIAKRTQPALTKTCKEIRHDAIKLYYSRNSFEAGYCSREDYREQAELVRWLECIGAEKRELLRKLRIVDIHNVEDGDYCMDELFSGSLLELGAEVEAVEGEFAVHMVTFPKAAAKE